jgi:DNA-binding transcriptional LysR family regulator
VLDVLHTRRTAYEENSRREPAEVLENALFTHLYYRCEIPRSSTLNLYLFLHGQESLFPDLTRQTLYTEPIVVAFPKAYRLATCSGVPLRALANEPFVRYARRQKPYTYDLVITLCPEAEFSPIIVQEAATEQAVIGLVAAGVGVSLAAGSLRDVHAR